MLISHRHWVALGALVASTLLIDYLYLSRSRAMPAKFLIPGTIFLLAFQVIPIIYTVDVAFTNYSTGHVITKSDAIHQIQLNSLQPPANGRRFRWRSRATPAGSSSSILQDDASRKQYVRTQKGLTPLAAASSASAAG